MVPTVTIDGLIALEPDEVFVKSASHRARQKLQSALGYAPQGYYTLWRKIPAAASYYVLTKPEFAKVAKIKGVSKARFRVEDRWHPSISHRNNPELERPRDFPAAFLVNVPMGWLVARDVETAEREAEALHALGASEDEIFVARAMFGSDGELLYSSSEDMGYPVDSATPWAATLAAFPYLLVHPRDRNIDDVVMLSWDGQTPVGPKDLAQASARYVGPVFLVQRTSTSPLTYERMQPSANPHPGFWRKLAAGAAAFGAAGGIGVLAGKLRFG